MPDSRHSSLRGYSTHLHGASPIDDAAESWVRRLQAGLSIDEEIEFAEWLAADPRHEARLKKYQAAWDRFAPMARSLAPDPASDPNRFVAGSAIPLRVGSTEAAGGFARSRPNVHRWIASVAGLAAAVVLLLTLPPSKRGPNGDAPIALPALCEQRTLADGSGLELNRGAVATVHFTETERRVRLERGEALFTVAKDSSRPFIVTAGGIEVRAVGTAFNVRFEPHAVEVVVTEGKVQVGGSTGSRRSVASSTSNNARPLDSTPGETYVTAGQEATVSLVPSAPPTRVRTLTTAEMQARLAWQPKLLDFDDVPLASIVAEFNRRNPVRLVVTDPVVANRRMTTSFRSDNLEAFIRLLETNIGVQAERLNEAEIALVRK